MNIDPNVFGKVLDTTNTIGKIAANLTDPKKPQNPNPPQQPKQEKNSTNQPHTQTVEVKVGNPDQQEKPVVVHEKKETHVHKSFPDGRSLTKDECEVEKLRIQTALENAREERQYNMDMEDMRRKERREREDYERRERERRREEQKKSDKRFRVIGYSLVGIGMVGLGYCLYTDYRNSRAAGLPVPEPKVNMTVTKNPGKPLKIRVSDKPIKAEGTVK